MNPPDHPQMTANNSPLKTRQVPVKILSLGLNRTGTQSLTLALGALGFPSSQFYDLGAIAQHKQEPTWTMHLDAKYKDQAQKKPLALEEFDDLIGEYCVIGDLMATLFVPELLAAYPEAKVILTTRVTKEEWYESCKATVIHAYNPEPAVNPTKRLADKCIQLLYAEDFEKSGKKIYEEHNKMVKELARGRVLEYRPGDGWEPLCKFLGVDVPEMDYPRQDAWLEYKKNHRKEGERMAVPDA